LLTVVSALGAAVVTAGLVVSAVAGHHVVRREEAPAGPSRVSEPATSDARAVLRLWDRRRAEAWADGDVAAIRALYVDRSATGRRDAAMLDAYRDRGLRVTGMTRQVLRFRVASTGPDRMALLVTDRLVDARVVGHGGGWAVPDGRPTTRRLLLRRQAGSWRVVEVERRQPAR
jgi:hypothetical protein